VALAELGRAVEAKSLIVVSLAIRRFRSRLSAEKSPRKLVAQAGKKLERVREKWMLSGECSPVIFVCWSTLLCYANRQIRFVITN
jgi:hypothetical protein